MPKVSVVIPTLNAAAFIKELLISLQKQTVSVDEIVVIDSSSTDGTTSIVSTYGNVRIVVIPREDFNHGITRHKAFMETQGDIVCFLTQDALPSNERYLENLLQPFKNQDVALCTGRQRPRSDARRFVQLVQNYNYPEESNVRSLADVPSLGIKTFFASDVCSAYRRTAYLECGGFQEVNTSEDMLMAASFLKNGWLVAYVADAEVVHSHNLSFMQQYERNKEVGIFLELHASELLGVSETGEGVQLVKTVSAKLIHERLLGELLCFGCDCFARILGNKKGRALARRLMSAQDMS